MDVSFHHAMKQNTAYMDVSFNNKGQKKSRWNLDKGYTYI